MNYSINFGLHRGDNFGSVPVTWHDDVKILEFGDAPYGFYEWVDDYFGDSEDEASPRMKFLDQFYDALHERIDQLNMQDNLQFQLEIQGLTFDVQISEDWED